MEWCSSSRSAAFVARRGPPNTHWELWRLIEVGLTWPAFLVHRRRDPVDAVALPTPIAVVYKLLKGLSPIAHHQAVCSVLPGGADVPVPDAGALFEWAEAHGKLIGPHEVCAGSEAQIRKLLEHVIHGGPATATQVDAGLVEAGLTFAQFGLLRFLHRLARTVAAKEAGAEPQLGPLTSALLEAPPNRRAALLVPFVAQHGGDEAQPLASVCDIAGDVSGRVAQIDRAFLDACVPLCSRLRGALGHDRTVPQDLLGPALIERLLRA